MQTTDPVERLFASQILIRFIFVVTSFAVFSKSSKRRFYGRLVGTLRCRLQLQCVLLKLFGTTVKVLQICPDIRFGIA